MLRQVAVFAMVRHHDLRAQDVVHRLDIRPVRVARDMVEPARVIGDQHALLGQRVLDAGDGDLVAGDRLGGKQEQVPLLQLMAQVAAPAERGGSGPAFALAAGDDQHEVARAAPPSPPRGDSVRGKSVRTPASTAAVTIRFIARPSRQIDRPCAAPASASVFSRATLEAKVVATTMPRASAISLPMGSGQLAFRPALVTREDVGRVADEGLHAAIRDIAEHLLVEGLAHHRVMVDLEVAGMDHPALGRVDDSAEASGMEWLTGANCTRKGPASVTAG
jgi:hypothetical protein